MTMFSKILIGAGTLAATVAIAAPAAAQGYPYGYGQQQNGGGVVGAIVNAVTGGGYGRYPQGNYGYGQVSQRASVQQCAAAAEYRLNGGNRSQGYGNQGYGNQYGYGNQGYAQGNARVVGITHVERRRKGGVHVVGIASSGQGYGSYGNQGYGNQGYGNQGYGYASQQGDVQFNCKVNSRGQVSDLRFNRLQQAYRRGY